MTFDATLDAAFKARLPLLYLETGEEVRAIAAITDAAHAQRNRRAVWTWTSALGLIGPDGKTYNAGAGSDEQEQSSTWQTMISGTVTP